MWKMIIVRPRCTSLLCVATPKSCNSCYVHTLHLKTLFLHRFDHCKILTYVFLDAVNRYQKNIETTKRSRNQTDTMDHPLRGDDTVGVRCVPISRRRQHLGPIYIGEIWQK